MQHTTKTLNNLLIDLAWGPTDLRRASGISRFTIDKYLAGDIGTPQRRTVGCILLAINRRAAELEMLPYTEDDLLAMLERTRDSQG